LISDIGWLPIGCKKEVKLAGESIVYDFYYHKVDRY
jgi:hypothetical protein